MKISKFVGGPMDGYEQVVADSTTIGTQYPFPISGEDRSAVYVFQTDGRFHFNRYGPPLVGKLSYDDKAEQEKTVDLMKRLAATLAELDEFFKKKGGYPPGVHVGGWVMYREPEKKTAGT